SDPMSWRLKPVEQAPDQQWHHHLMVPRDLVSLAALQRGTLDDVHARAIVALLVEIDRDEIPRFSGVEIPRDRERLEKDLGHDHRAAEVEHDTTVVDLRERRGEATEVAVARVTDRGAIGLGMLVNDLGAECGVDGRRYPEAKGVEEQRQLRVGELGLCIERAAERLAHTLTVSH